MKHIPSSGLLVLSALLGGFTFPWLLQATPARAGSSLTEAVRFARETAEIVLERGGAESCLRGKLTKALLGLSSSCEAAGEPSPLCALADRAVVVTPMSLAFMDATARQLLELSAPAQASRYGSAASAP